VVAELRDFYLDRLGFDTVDDVGEDLLVLRTGSAVARFSEAPAASEAPFYHFALLIPGNRFDEAYTWLGARTDLLPDPDTADTTFEFDNWDAVACYCLDPSGNIIELIAHRGISETSTEGPFIASEFVDFSEVGLVVPDKAQSVAVLEQQMGLSVWDGEIADPNRLVFVGERARTLILSPQGRGWLPTGRPAEAHPVEITIRGSHSGEAVLPGTQHRISSVTR
jgi:catechol 2,3-dioxygenase-like lactoylglutathione lyase family enzyme